MYNKYKFSCKDCTKRYLGCHSECEDYINAKKQGEKEKEEIRKTKDRMWQLSDFRAQSCRKAMRNH